MESDTPIPSPPEQTPEPGSPPGQTPTPQGLTPNGPPQQKTPIDSLPADVQDYIKSLRTEAETTRKQLDAEARAKKRAEETRLKEQGEYKQLADQHEARVKELEPISERYTQLAELVADQITTETKNWPQELKTFDPGRDAPIESRLEWVKKSRPLIEKLQPHVRPGNAPNPKPAGNGQQTGDVDVLRQRYRETGKYSF